MESFDPPTLKMVSKVNDVNFIMEELTKVSKVSQSTSCLWIHTKKIIKAIKIGNRCYIPNDKLGHITWKGRTLRIKKRALIYSKEEGKCKLMPTIQ